MKVLQNFYEEFTSPPKGYGEVAFFWWLGDKLTKERLLWQLEKLENSKITGLQVNYAHCDTGGVSYGLTYKSDPPLFSKDWWELYGWFMGECKKRGISVSLSDYTLGTAGQGYYADEIIAAHPNMRGKKLICNKHIIKKQQKFDLTINANIVAINCIKLDENNNLIANTCENVDFIGKNEISITNLYNTLVTVVEFEEVEFSLDPMHENSGSEVIDKFFKVFEDKFPNECGKGLNFFFSDELSFGISGELYNDKFLDEFQLIKGYDLKPVISAIFEDIGDITPKVRLDYYDVIVLLQTKNYFNPIFSWHENRGMTYGCDHGGRGLEVTEFGDYFRTQKYNQGPGCDQPMLQCNLIKNKVASSIAHLYDRDRTWLEGFHSSGWGTTTEELTEAVFKNFVSGHNLLSLHGLYYSTHGGFWEWAPPCNHFRMPYWKCMGDFFNKTERLSWLLTVGEHLCDVAIFYPVADKEAMGELSCSDKVAFEIANTLYENCIDFDFIDFESLNLANVVDKHLTIKNRKYSTIIIPSMKVLRHKSLEKCVEFLEANGLTIVVGNLPTETDKTGRNNEDVLNLSKKLAKHNVETSNEVLELIKNNNTLDFKYLGTKNKPMYQHRVISGKNVYIVYAVDKNEQCFFRAKGKVNSLDLNTGKKTAITPISTDENGTVLKIANGKKEINIFVFDENEVFENELISNENECKAKTITNEINLNGEWESTIIPTSDNKFGDFRLPAFDGFIGAEARIINYSTDNVNWEKGTCGFGSHFDCVKINKNDANLSVLEAKLISGADFKELDSSKYESFKYRYSTRYGIEDDPGHQGYHGLKGLVTDDFLAFGERKEDWTHIKYLDDENFYYLSSKVTCDGGKYKAKMGSEKPIFCFINGTEIDGTNISYNNIVLNKGENTVLLKYASGIRTHFLLEKADADEFKIDYPLSMSFYNNPNILEFKNSANKKHYFKFQTAPGVYEIELPTNAEIEASINGVKQTVVNNKICLSEKIEKPAEVTLIATGNDDTAIFNDYIKFKCDKGIITLGDWSKLEGLYSYSGGIKYSKKINLDAEYSFGCLNLTEVYDACEVFVNGNLVGSKSSPNWEFDVKKYLKMGENTVDVIVYNSLSNHYTTIPTRYRGELTSGLIGPVKLSLGN